SRRGRSPIRPRGPRSMTEPSSIGPARAFARSTIVGGSYYAAACISSGGLSAIVADLIDRNGMTWFWFGLCLPIGPLYFLYASGWMMERQLARLKRWKDA